MVEEFLRKTSKKSWYKWSFYINVILIFIVAIMLYFVVIDAYNAGTWYNNPAIHSQWMFALARDLSILAVVIAFLFVQLIRNISIIIRRSL